MTADDLVDRFLAILQRTRGGSRRRWRSVIGPVRVYSIATHPHCNWSIIPGGSLSENEIVEAIADTLRNDCPVIEAN